MNIITKLIKSGTKRRSGRLLNKVVFFVDHDTGNPYSTSAGNVNYFINSANSMSASAHVFIDDKGVIICIPCLDKPEKAWHVLYDMPTDNKLYGDDANDIAIGLELCYFPNDKQRTLKAYNNYIEFAAYLARYHNVDPMKRSGHFQLDPGRKVDPNNALKIIGKTYENMKQDILNEYNKYNEESKGGNLISSGISRLLEKWEIENKYNTLDRTGLIKIIYELTTGKKVESLIEDVENPIDTSNYPDLKYESTGEYVSLLENRLKELNYMSTYIDSYLGTITIKAVKKFQADEGLKVDGLVGQVTWKKLFEGVSNTISTPQTPVFVPKVGYEKIRFNNDTDVHIYAYKKSPELVLGVRNKLETLPNILKQYDNVVCGINSQMIAYDGSQSDGYGVLITDDAKDKEIKDYYYPGSKTFLDYIVWKNNTVTIEQSTGDVKRLIEFQKDSEFACGTSYALMINGKKSTLNWDKFSHSKDKANRSMIAFDSVNKMHYLIVADGRTKSNKGLTSEDQYKLAKLINVTDMANLDGGFSSVMIVNGKVVTENKPTRAIGTALIFQG